MILLTLTEGLTYLTLANTNIIHVYCYRLLHEKPYIFLQFYKKIKNAFDIKVQCYSYGISV